MSTTREALIKARNYFVENPTKWYQNAYFDAEDETRVCGLGALYLTSSGNPLPIVVSEACQSALIALDDATPIRNYVAWQDEPERTVEEVIAVFDKAIATFFD